MMLIVNLLIPYPSIKMLIALSVLLDAITKRILVIAGLQSREQAAGSKVYSIFS